MSAAARFSPLLANAARGPGFVLTPRGVRLYAWTRFPQGRVDGLLFVWHGFGAHCSRPPLVALADRLVAMGVGMVTCDFHGHGRSGGERGTIVAASDLVEDAWSVLEAVYSPRTGQAGGLGLEAQQVGALPFAMLGHSMGGAVAARVVAALEARNPPWAALFRGTVLIAPMFDIPTPPPPVLWFARQCVARVIPTFAPPRSAARLFSTDPRLWTCDTYRLYVQADAFPCNPQGLSWETLPPLRTATVLLDLSQAAVRADALRCPVLALHDPDDNCCRVAGTRRFLEACQTPQVDKHLVEVCGGLHDPLVNEFDRVVGSIVLFLAAYGVSKTPFARPAQGPTVAAVRSLQSAQGNPYPP